MVLFVEFNIFMNSMDYTEAINVFFKCKTATEWHHHL